MPPVNVKSEKSRVDPQGWGLADDEVVDTDTGEVLTPAVLEPEVLTTHRHVLDLEHFKLGPTGLVVKGRPSFEEWEGIGELLKLFEQGVQWLIGDWLAYGEGIWGDKIAQVVDATEWAEETIRVYRWVAARVPPQNREPKLPFAAHMAVAELEPGEQRKWLDRALKGDGDRPWPVKELQRQLKAKELGVSPDAVHYYAIVEAESEIDQQALARQLENLSRKFVLKSDKRIPS